MNIYKNSMGTISFDYKFNGMRKEQDFCVYPMQEKSDTLKVQSDTRIGTINLNTGEVKMSKPRSGGSYFYHLSLDKLNVSFLNEDDLKELKESVQKTGSKFLVGDNHILSNNSGALEI